eukprot:4784007-Pyramimonas_sp.AAC.1
MFLTVKLLVKHVHRTQLSPSSAETATSSKLRAFLKVLSLRCALNTSARCPLLSRTACTCEPIM